MFVLRRIGRRYITISGKDYSIPYQGCSILTTAEAHGFYIPADCRKGTCKTCSVEVVVHEGSSISRVPVLACQETAEDWMILDLTVADIHDDPDILDEKKRRVTRRLKRSKTEVEALRREVHSLVETGMNAFIKEDWQKCHFVLTQLQHLLASCRPEDIKHGKRSNLLDDTFMHMSFSSNTELANRAEEMRAWWARIAGATRYS
eukprot:GEMP01099896.1.p1 GENE.GEMP01099896.1~~GEMP01099896.1.p1  ORF type:complete len:235 (+),score=28.03 GEMP01099896.1:96-707(+)